MGGAKRRPLISPHFSKRIWSVAFGDAHFSFGEEEVRIRSNFDSIVFALIQKEFLLYCMCIQLQQSSFLMAVSVNSRRLELDTTGAAI